MRVIAAICFAVTLCLWGQALCYPSQIWTTFAVLWTAILIVWGTLYQIVRVVQTRSHGNGGGRGAAVSALALMTCAMIFEGPSGSQVNQEAQFDQISSAAVADASVTQGKGGHFKAMSLVNGQPIEMMVDTGSSVVLLRHEDAQAAGFDMAALSFDTPVYTANGKSFVARTQIASISLNGVWVQNIAAAIAQPGQVHKSLLGMSFINALDEVIIRGNQMIFKAKVQGQADQIS